ncbi:MAG: hypothetical protein J2P36_14600, partial [Ktedonobacteraceae bacterium]|nr:hypothetical protein [Ktedonobacteraceae bacterium]
MIVKPRNRHLLQRESILALLLITFAGGLAFLNPGNTYVADIIGQALYFCIAVISVFLALPIFLPEAQQTRWRPASLLKEMIFPKSPQQWVPLLLLLAMLLCTVGQF